MWISKDFNKSWEMSLGTVFYLFPMTAAVRCNIAKILSEETLVKMESVIDFRKNTCIIIILFIETSVCWNRTCQLFNIYYLVRLSLSRWEGITCPPQRPGHSLPLMEHAYTTLLSLPWPCVFSSADKSWWNNPIGVRFFLGHTTKQVQPALLPKICN